MDHRGNDLDASPDLLGYHLGLVDPVERRGIEAAFAKPEALQAACDSLRALLAPLDADVSEPAPADLVDGVLRRVEQSHRTIPFVRAAAAEPAAVERGRGGGPLLSPRELVGLAAAILMFVGIFVPGYYTARGTARKIACANNLRLMGNGYAGYAESNASQWPFAGFAPANARWGSVGGQGQPALRNSRHIYPLVRGRFVPAAAFNCPGREGDMVFQPEDPMAYHDFPDPRYISYATNFLTGPWQQQTFLPNMPIAAGMTPLVDENRRLIRGRPVPANSQNHGRSGGQNVLYANLSVRFYTSPKAGVDHDDIYRLHGVRQYNGLERPRSRNDAFLIP